MRSICKIEGCGRFVVSHGICAMHNERLKRNGDLFKTKRAANGEGTVVHGYRVITLPNGRRVKEHRHIMEHMLGRPINSHELVHHIDGNRMNNDMDNLMLTNRADHVKTHTTKTFRNETHKQCTKCLQIKPRFFFTPVNIQGSDPHTTTCKQCDAERAYLKRKTFKPRYRY